MKGQDALVRTKRAYHPPDRSDGARGLVDRLWPRGLRKENSALTCWLKESHRAQNRANGSAAILRAIASFRAL
jgi:uncharacterized protein YeaO (DUF488 family)